MSPRRGDIHFVAFPDGGGHVLRGPHPAVVVQTDRMQRSSTVVVVPMTSSAKSAAEAPPYLVAVGARESGLDRDGFAKCDQPATLPVVVLGPRAGRLNPATIERVDSALRFVLEL
ncbi:MAG TPA: type II toxin-antitoxin system PemK/MazF family toxin [Candidatus Eisenbacteria bacterium]|nr:type II toxin-antitoxin system PemK/MazF family toxin [Candidatus Eisenbacteria bacterium]